MKLGLSARLARTLILASQHSRFRGVGGYSPEAFAKRGSAAAFPQATRESSLYEDFFQFFRGRFDVEAAIRGRDVLDYGSGYGGRTVDYARRGGARHVWGVEPVESHITLAEQYAASLGVHNVGFKVCGATTVPLPDASVDVVLSYDVLEHVQSPPASVAEIQMVLATGASHGYFGHDEWAEHAPGLKSVEDATRIRSRILDAFEQAEVTDDPATRAKLLTFLIVGAGPTGVELAGAIAELARNGMAKDFRNFDPAEARIILVEAAPRVLPPFDTRLSAFARGSLEALGVEVRLDSKVEVVDAQGVVVNGERIFAATVLWAAGVVASPAAKWLGLEPDRAGRIKVGPDLSVPGLPNVFAIGDTALALAWEGRPVPGLAAAAKQEGAYVGAVLRARLHGRAEPAPFRYRHRGSLATIGRESAVADFGRFRLVGSLAWWLWGTVHVLLLVGLRNRLTVVVGWLWSYFSYDVGVRLITGEKRRRADVPEAAPAYAKRRNDAMAA